MSHTDVGNSCASLFFSSHFHYTQPARSITPPNMTMSVPHLRDDEEFIDGLSWGVLKKFCNYVRFTHRARICYRQYAAHGLPDVGAGYIIANSP
jgi:hypothetical protein